MDPETKRTSDNSLSVEFAHLLKAVGHGPWGIAGVIVALALVLGIGMLIRTFFG